MRRARYESDPLARIMIVGLLAGALSVPTPASAQLFDADQRRHLVDCLFLLFTDPALQAASCRAQPGTTAAVGAAGGGSPVGSGSAVGGATGADSNTGTYSEGANTGSFGNGDQNTGTYTPDQNSGSFNDGSANSGSYNP